MDREGSHRKLINQKCAEGTNLLYKSSSHDTNTPQDLLFQRMLQLFYTERLVAEEKLHLMLYHHGIIQKATQEPNCKECGLQ